MWSLGHLYVKSDVYGFGVVLLEMLSGQRALDTNRPSGQQNLVEWAKSFLADRRKLARLMDPRLEGQYPSKGAVLAAQLTLKCLAGEPKSRPSMKEVVENLEQIEAMKSRSRQSREAASQPTTRSHGNSHSATPHRSPLRRGPDGASQAPGQLTSYYSPKVRWFCESDLTLTFVHQTNFLFMWFIVSLLLLLFFFSLFTMFIKGGSGELGDYLYSCWRKNVKLIGNCWKFLLSKLLGLCFVKMFLLTVPTLLIARYQWALFL